MEEERRNGNMGAERVRLEVVKSHCLGGGRDVEIGDVLMSPGDLTPVEAETKVRMGYAVVVVDDQIPTTASPEDDTDPEGETEEGPPEDDTDPEEVETGDPVVESRDPVSPTPTPPKPGGGRKGRKK